MITITKQENMAYKQVKYMQLDYSGSVSENILKMDLDLTEHDFKEVLENLERKNLIERNEGKVKALTPVDEISVVDTRKQVRTAELDQMEIDALEIIKKLADDKGQVSRYIVEGNLLYGELKVSNFRMYHILISLENKGLIKKVLRSDGEYYQFSV